MAKTLSRIIIILGIVLINNISYAETLETTFNAFTSKLDYINDLENLTGDIVTSGDLTVESLTTTGIIVTGTVSGIVVVDTVTASVVDTQYIEYSDGALTVRDDITFNDKLLFNNIGGAGSMSMGDTSPSSSSGDNNIFIGDDAGTSNTTGYRNVFIGKSAGNSNTEGLRNTYIGFEAGKTGTDGTQNVCLGSAAGSRFEATASNNMLIGTNAGQFMTSVQDNKCLYCDKEFGTPYERNNKVRFTKVHYDHLIPYSYSQSCDNKDFVASCNICNHIKYNLMFDTVEEVFRYVEYNRKKKGYKYYEDICDVSSMQEEIPTKT